MEANEIILDVWERLSLKHVLEQQRVNLGQMMMLMEMVQRIALTDEEKEVIKLQQTRVGPTWDDTHGAFITLSVEPPDAKYIAKTIEKFDGWRVMDGQRVLEMYNKFDQVANNEQPPEAIRRITDGV